MSKLSCRRPDARTSALALICAAAASFAGGAATAQKLEANAAADDGYGIAEITVTARKREEHIQDTPISIVGLSSEDIERRQIVNLADVAQHAPNVEFHANGAGGSSSGQAFIRGVGQSDYFMTTDPGIGVYVDGVYLARSLGSILDLVDVDRIEILRGPQGTLYGKNTIGGAINIVSAKPDLSSASGRVEAKIGRFDRIDVRGRAEIPLIDGVVAAKIAFSSRNSDGIGRRPFTGEEQGDENRDAVQAVMRWKMSDDADLTITADKTRTREKFSAVHLEEIANVPLVGLYNAFVAPYDSRYILPTRYDSAATGSNFNRSDIWGVSGTLDWDLDAAMLKAITAYRRLKSDFGTDPDGSPEILVDEQDHNRQNQFTQELQLSGSSLDNSLKWVLGAYYLRESASTTTIVDLYPALYQVIGLDLSRQIEARQNTRSYSAYGQASYALATGLNATFGLRYTHEKKDYEASLYLFQSGIFLINPTNRSKSWDAVSPRLGLDYRLNNNVMAYASAASGFKSGGFNGRSSTTNEIQPYSPEKIWTYEAGVKSDWLDNRLRFNLSAYYNDYRDIQFMLSTADPTGAQVVIVGNAARARVAGGEAELVAMPLPRVLLSASAGMIDAKFTSVAAGAQITKQSHFASTPKFSSSVSAQYDAPLGEWGELTLRADYSYRSRIYYEVNNAPAVRQGGYGLLNLQGSLDFGDGRYGLTLAMTNVANKRYKSTAVSVLDSLGFASVQYGRPREWSLTARAKF